MTIFTAIRTRQGWVVHHGMRGFYIVVGARMTDSSMTNHTSLRLRPGVPGKIRLGCPDTVGSRNVEIQSQSKVVDFVVGHDS